MNFSVVYPRYIEKVRKKKNAIVIDLRDTKEYTKSHYRGAINYPLKEFETGKISLSHGRSYILYCEHGSNSMRIAQSLGMKGYDVATVIGGYQRMQKEI